jgi:alkenylglycerophosphocholine/alkenylglycerophosphoethanolamine hydrolase
MIGAIALGVAAVLAVVDWVGVVRVDRQLRWIGKPGTMVALILAALLAEHPPSGVRIWIVVGLALSLAGDVFLLLTDERWFAPGLGSFLLAHLAYIVAMVQLHLTRSLFGVALVVLALGIGTVGVRVVVGAARHDRTLQLPVLMYVCVISTMVAFAVATESPWLIAAALLFYASDLMLGWERFVTPRAFSGLAVMITYHLAQAGFVVFLLTR